VEVIEVRRFVRRFRIGKRVVQLNIAVYDTGFIAIDSGKPYQDVQYLFMDYDDFYPMVEGIKIIRDYKIRRALIIESTPKHFQLASFTPLPVPVIADILFHSKCDKRHAAQLFKRGSLGLRVSCKGGVKLRVVQTLRNYKGTNFYNYDAEREYRHVIREAQDEPISGLDMGEGDDEDV
jgi:hypothetical protein